MSFRKRMVAFAAPLTPAEWRDRDAGLAGPWAKAINRAQPTAPERVCQTPI